MNWAIYRFPKLLTWNWSASTGCFLTALSQKSVFSRSALGKQVDFVTTREQTPRTSRYPGLPGSRAISRQLLQTDCQAGPPSRAGVGVRAAPPPCPWQWAFRAAAGCPGFELVPERLRGGIWHPVTRGASSPEVPRRSQGRGNHGLGRATRRGQGRRLQNFDPSLRHLTACLQDWWEPVTSA